MSTQTAKQSSPTTTAVPVREHEPSEEWKQRLRETIEKSLLDMVADAKTTLEEELKRAPVDVQRREVLTKDYTKTMSDIRKLATEQFRDAVERETQERRWLAGQQLGTGWQEVLQKEQSAIMDHIKKEDSQSIRSQTRASTHEERLQRGPRSSSKPERDYAPSAYRDVDSGSVRNERSVDRSRTSAVPYGSPPNDRNFDSWTGRSQVEEPEPIVPSIDRPSRLGSERLNERPMEQRGGRPVDVPPGKLYDRPQERYARQVPIERPIERSMERPVRSSKDASEFSRRPSASSPPKMNPVPEIWKPSISPEEDAAHSRTYTMARRGSSASMSSRPNHSPHPSYERPNESVDISGRLEWERKTQEAEREGGGGPKEKERQQGQYRSEVRQSNSEYRTDPPGPSPTSPRSADNTTRQPSLISSIRPVVKERAYPPEDSGDSPISPRSARSGDIGRQYSSAYAGRPVLKERSFVTEQGESPPRIYTLNQSSAKNVINKRSFSVDEPAYHPKSSPSPRGWSSSSRSPGDNRYDSMPRSASGPDESGRPWQSNLRSSLSRQDVRSPYQFQYPDSRERGKSNGALSEKSDEDDEDEDDDVDLSDVQDSQGIYMDPHAKYREDEARRNSEIAARREAEARREVEARWKEEDVKRKVEEAKQREAEAKRKEEEIQRKEEEARRKEEEVRRKEEEAQRKEEEVQRKEEEAQRKAADARRQEKEAKRKGEEAKRKEAEVRRLEEEAIRKEEEIRLKAEATMQKELEVARREAEVKRREDALNRREAESRKKEEEARRKQEEARKREEEAREKEEEERRKKEELKRRDDEAKSKDEEQKRMQQEEFRKREEDINRRRAEQRNRQNSTGSTYPSASPPSSGPSFGAPNRNASSVGAQPPSPEKNGTAPSRSSSTSNWSTPSWPSGTSASAQASSTARTSTTSARPTVNPPRTPLSATGPSPVSEAEWRRRQEENAQKQYAQFQREQERLELERQAKEAKEGRIMNKEDLVRLFDAHERQWTRLPNLDDLSWDAFPWPTLKRPFVPEDLTSVGISAYVLSPHHPGDKSKSSKDRIKEHIRRWHPDRFETKLLPKVTETERDKVKQGAGLVARSLNELLTRSNVHDVFS